MALLLCAGSWWAMRMLPDPRPAKTTMQPNPPLTDPGLALQIPGATVELAGVTINWYPAMAPPWWHASGMPLSLRSWTMDQHYIPTWRMEVQQRLLAIRAKGQEEPARIMSIRFAGIDVETARLAIHSDDARPGEWCGLLATLPLDQSTVSFRVLVTSGQFQSPDVGSVTPQKEHEVTGRFDDATFQYTQVVDRDGTSIFRVQRCKTVSPSPFYEYRLRSKDRNGQWHTAELIESVADPATKSIRELYRFAKMTTDELSDPILERRRGYAVEFQGIALNCYQSTEPRAVLVEWIDGDE